MPQQIDENDIKLQPAIERLLKGDPSDPDHIVIPTELLFDSESSIFEHAADSEESASPFPPSSSTSSSSSSPSTTSSSSSSSSSSVSSSHSSVSTPSHSSPSPEEPATETDGSPSSNPSTSSQELNTALLYLFDQKTFKLPEDLAQKRLDQFSEIISTHNNLIRDAFAEIQSLQIHDTHPTPQRPPATRSEAARNLFRKVKSGEAFHDK